MFLKYIIIDARRNQTDKLQRQNGMAGGGAWRWRQWNGMSGSE